MRSEVSELTEQFPQTRRPARDGGRSPKLGSLENKRRESRSLESTEPGEEPEGDAGPELEPQLKKLLELLGRRHGHEARQQSGDQTGLSHGGEALPGG